MWMQHCPLALDQLPRYLMHAIEWIVREHGVPHLWHYLDDFITCGPAGSEECLFNLQLLTDVCRHLGVPLAEEKLEGPTTSLVFLGILIGTVQGELCLTGDKLERLQTNVKEWLQKRRCTKQELLSTAGQLHYAATVVWPDRAFLRRLFDLSATVKKPNHHVSLNTGARSDLAWWNVFLEQWNGVSLLAVRGE